MTKTWFEKQMEDPEVRAAFDAEVLKELYATNDRVEELEVDRGMLENKVELLNEDLECIHQYLDDEGAPREGKEGSLSIVGRIKRLMLGKAT